MSLELINLRQFNSKIFEDRLTWNSAWPLPFESFWSVTNKVLQLNHLTWAEFAELIKRPEVDVPPNIIESSNSWWVDFTRFSMLLDVAPSRLQEGFRDQFGLDAGHASFGIRHCPICWKEHFYHCLLFDLAVVKECPVHRCTLLAPCKRCTSSLRFSLRIRKGEAGAVRHCGACKMITPSINALINSSEPNADYCDILRKHGHQFLEWWTQVGDSFSARDILVTDVLYAGFESGPKWTAAARYHPWQRYIAVEAARDRPPNWINIERVVPVRYAYWREVLCPTNTMVLRDVHRQDLWASDEGRCYRSLKRYICNRYIRPYADCYQKLLKLTWAECQELDGDELCIPVLAFVVWRMSIEGVVRIEGLRENPRLGFQLKLMTIEGYSPMSLPGRLRWSYFAFLSIWEQLGSLQGRCNFRILLSDVQYRSNFLYRCRPASDVRDRFSDPTEIHIHLLAPDPLFLELKAIQHDSCRKANLEPQQHIYDKPGVSSAYADVRRCLFQVNHPARSWTNRAYHDMWV